MAHDFLQYSPVNGLIVKWGDGAKSFSSCGLPKPLRQRPMQPASDEDLCCVKQPAMQQIDLCDWGKWLPEVGVGINDFEEEIAASYVRQAAIEFCKGSRVLQRSVYIPVQEGVYQYPLVPLEHETVVGVMAVLDGQFKVRLNGDGGYHNLAVFRQGFDDVLLDKDLVDSACRKHPRREMVELLVWTAPTEEACLHDRLLYDRHRQVISDAARGYYVAAYHYDNRALVASLTPMSVFRAHIKAARTRSTSWLTEFSQTHTRGYSVWG